jgi:hydroxyacylglutathione hydrolase
MDILFCIGLKWEIISLPSHTSGSLAVVIGDVAFVGDLFRASIVGKKAQTHLYICDEEANQEYIRTFLEANPELLTFCPGHFGPDLSRKSVLRKFGE